MNARFAWAALALAVVGLIVWAFAALDSGPLTPGPNERLVQVVELPRDARVEFEVRRWPSGEVVHVRSKLARAAIPANEALLVRVSNSKGDSRVVRCDPDSTSTPRAVELRLIPRPPARTVSVGPWPRTRAQMFFVPSEYLLAPDHEIVAWLEETALAERELRAFLDGSSSGLTAESAAAIDHLLEWSMDGRVSRVVDGPGPAPGIATPAGGSAVLAWFDAAGRVATDGSAHELHFWERGRVHHGKDGSVVLWSMKHDCTLTEGFVDVYVRAPDNGYIFGQVPESWDGARIAVLGPKGPTGEAGTSRRAELTYSGELFFVEDLRTGTYRIEVASLGGDGVLRVFSERITVSGPTGHEFSIPAACLPRVEFELVCSGVPTAIVDASFAAHGAPFEIFFETDRHKFQSPRLQPSSRHFVVEGLAVPTCRVSTSPGVIQTEPGVPARPPRRTGTGEELILVRGVDQSLVLDSSTRIELPVDLIRVTDLSQYDLVLESPSGNEPSQVFQVSLMHESGSGRIRRKADWDEVRRRHVARPRIDELTDGTYTLVADAIRDADPRATLGAVVVANGRIVSDRNFVLAEGHRLALRLEGSGPRDTELVFEFTTPDGRSDVPWRERRVSRDNLYWLPRLPYGTAVRVIDPPAHPTSFLIERGVEHRTLELFE